MFPFTGRALLLFPCQIYPTDTQGPTDTYARFVSVPQLNGASLPAFAPYSRNREPHTLANQRHASRVKPTAYPRIT